MPTKLRELVRLLVVTVVITRSVSASVCSSPVAYNTNGFIIKGPCPNDLVVAPVNSTIKYRCDYTINQGALSYWHIVQLPGSPFIIGEAEAPVNNIVISDVFSASKGHTVLDIPVLQQYLNETLFIQCGLCSFIVCGNKPLSENISSSVVVLVAFSTPSLLHQKFVGDAVVLSWSSPVVSIDYTNQINFQYQVVLSDVLNSSEVATLTVEDNHLNVRKLNITSQELCTRYLWSVTAMVGERKSEAVESDEAFTDSSGPVLLHESFLSTVTQDGSMLNLSFTFKVLSCSDLGDLSQTVTIQNDTELPDYIFSMVEICEERTTLVQYYFTIPLSKIHGMNITLFVTVNDNFGSVSTTYSIFNNTFTMDTIQSFETTNWISRISYDYQSISSDSSSTISISMGIEQDLPESSKDVIIDSTIFSAVGLFIIAIIGFIVLGAILLIKNVKHNKDEGNPVLNLNEAYCTVREIKNNQSTNENQSNMFDGCVKEAIRMKNNESYVHISLGTEKHTFNINH